MGNFKLEYNQTEQKVESFWSHMINTRKRKKKEENKEQKKSQMTIPEGMLGKLEICFLVITVEVRYPKFKKQFSVLKKKLFTF